jgi:DEAD/DEAH box helicase domain-containing protein
MDNLDRLLAHWRADPSVGGNIAHWHNEPARPAAFQPLPADIHPAIGAAFAKLGYGQLFSHQAQAWETLKAGHNIAVVTGTASGKTLCYNLPVLDALLRDQNARALYLFPTKALAYDQKNELETWMQAITGRGGVTPPLDGEGEGTSPLRKMTSGKAPLSSSAGEGPGVRIATYDGDTPTHHRSNIRKHSRLLITNPDMLHYGILPNHTQWAEFFGKLRYIVIDEMHSYRGVFGSHVANVLRRLNRLLKFYGAKPQFVMASATIANPQDLAQRLIEQPVTIIDRDGSPRGARNFIVYNPPIVDPELGLRASLVQESVRLVSDLLAYDVQTILFGRTRRMVEVMLKTLRETSRDLTLDANDLVSQVNTRRGEVTSPLTSEGGETPPLRRDSAGPGVRRIRGYRGGYLVSERRAIEAGLRSGELRAVVATNALELGVDIGGMGAAVLAGYPGSIAATWQQAGRSGRGADSSAAILVASSNPLDQFLARHPDYLMGRTPEHALINPDNLLILLSHIRCAAFELPFTRGDAFGSIPANEVEELLNALTQGNELHASGDKYFWMKDVQPSRGVSLRGMGSDSVVIQAQTDEGVKLVGEVDPFGAMWLVHPDAIYIHDGATYFVEKLDLDEHIAYLRPIEADYYTVPKSRSTVSLVAEKTSEPVHGGVKHFGEVNITQEIVGYDKIQWSGIEKPGGGELDLPPMELNTFAYWLSLNESTVDDLRERGLWTNDPNEYGPNWNTIRDQVRARDQYTCQVCGLPENGRPHDVHHKTPFRTFASIKEANQLDNLITLCRNCHRRAETIVRIRSGLAGLSFVLQHLAPLYLMCDPRDLGVFSDPKSDLADGAPVVMVFDQMGDAMGFSQRLFEIHAELMRSAYDLVRECGCQDGCPSCVGPGGEQGQGSKRETLALLEALIVKSRSLEVSRS